MGVSKEALEALKRMVRDIGGPELSDEGMEQVMAQVQLHQAQSDRLRKLDLSKVLPARLMRADAGGRES